MKECVPGISLYPVIISFFLLNTRMNDTIKASTNTIRRRIKQLDER